MIKDQRAVNMTTTYDVLPINGGGEKHFLTDYCAPRAYLAFYSPRLISGSLRTSAEKTKTPK